MQTCKAVVLVVSVILLANHGHAFMSTPALINLRRSDSRTSSPTSLGRKWTMKVDLLKQVETLKVLTAVSKSGLLSKIEKAGLLSKLEKQGALSQVEKLLPLLDNYRAISLLETFVNIEPITFTLAATGILIADGILIATVPDSSTELIALQVVLTILALTASAPLFIGAQINTIIQGTTPLGE